jgi:hypothetical protein
MCAGRSGEARSGRPPPTVRGGPDLFLWHAHHGFVALELKVGADKPTPEQTQVLAELAAAGARTMVAYPHDLAEVQAVLSVR